jgi:hypothetical protein
MRGGIFFGVVSIYICCLCCGMFAAYAQQAPKISVAASAAKPILSAEKLGSVAGPHSGKGPIKKAYITPLGTLELIDTDADNEPDTATLDGRLVIAPRKATNGLLYTLYEVSFKGYLDKKTQQYIHAQLVFEHHGDAYDGCQQIFLDFTGRDAWISPPFPNAERFPGWVGGCLEISWVAWKGPYVFFYFGPEVTHPIFAYNPKLKAVIGPIDPDDAPKHPKDARLDRLISTGKEGWGVCTGNKCARADELSAAERKKPNK